MANPTLRIALISSRFCDDAAVNLERHRAWLERVRTPATDSGAPPDLVLFPEFSLTGWRYDAEGALALDDRTVAAATALAGETSMHVGFGLVERAGTTLYNTFVVAGPHGVCGTMRKINLTPGEARHYHPGRELPVFDVAGVRVGVATCADATRFEMHHQLSLRGAEVILAPHANSLKPYGNHRDGWIRWRRERWPLFARDCCVAIAGVSCAGEADPELPPVPDADDAQAQRFCGGAMIVDHTGASSAVLDGACKREGLLIGEIDVAALREARAGNSLLDSFQAAIVYNRADGWQHGNPPLPAALPG